MSERTATTGTGTVAWVFRTVEGAEAGARRLRAAGFADVRLSEGAGTTTEAHVPENVGMTASDFAATLVAAGFASHDARDLTDAVAAGETLVTLAAAGNVERALAVLRGETVEARSLSPVDVAPVEPPLPAIAPDDERTIELRAERLAVEKQRIYSEARIRKETVTEQRTITVPVRHERLVVERDGEEPIHIPISGES